MVIESTTLVLTVEDAGELLGLSRPSAYLAVKRGQLPIIKIGRRVLVPRAALEKMLADVKPTKPTAECVR